MKKILIADDDIAITELLSTFLKEKNFFTITASDGVQTLLRIKNEVPDLIILDIKMSGLDGYHIADEIKNLKKPPPIIFITGRPIHKKEKNIASAVGCAGFFSKPINLEELLKTIKQTLRD